MVGTSFMAAIPCPHGRRAAGGMLLDLGHPQTVSPKVPRRDQERIRIGAATGVPVTMTSPTAASARITSHDGSTSIGCMLNFGERGWAWWLLWRLSPAVTHASSRVLYAVLLKRCVPRQ